MKAIKRKLLSLVLAVAMVMTLAPTAFAGSGGEGGSSTENPPATDNYTSEITGTGSANVGQSVTLEASLKNNNTPVTNGVKYEWTIPSGMELTSNTSVTSKSVTIQAAGSPTSAVTGKVSCVITYNNQTYNPTARDVSFTPVSSSNPGTATKLSVSGSTDTFTVGGTTSVTVSVKALPASGNTGIAGVNVSASVSGNLLVRASGGNNQASTTASSTTAEDNGDAYASFTISLGSAPVTAQTTGTVTFSSTGLTSATYTITIKPSTSTVTVATTNSAATVAVGNTLGVYVLSGAPTAGYNAITWESSNNAVLTVTGTTANATINAVAAGEATVTVKYKNGDTVVASGTSAKITVTGSSGAHLTGTPDSGTTISLTSWNGYDSTYYYTFRVTPSYGNLVGNALTDAYTVTYDWYLGTSSVYNNWHLANAANTDYANGNSYTLYSNERGLYYNGTVNNVLTCRATFTSRTTGATTTATAYWYIGNNTYSGTIFASATIYRSSSSYALGEKDDAGRSSIVSQLDGYFYNNGTYRYGYGVSHVMFSNTRDTTTGSSLNATVGASYYVNYRNVGTTYSNLANVLFYPGTTTGTATFPVRVYYYTNQSYTTTDYVDGAITFAVTGTAYNGDITYSASIGSDVSFVLKDFEDFYYKKTYGSLSYVSFTLPSGGVLYADGGRLINSNACYVSPGRNQTDLAGVYFSPTGTTANRANTVHIGFTAYGTRANTSGTIVITYLAGNAKDITYNIYSSGTLKAADFTDAYRQVIGSTAPNGLTIEFQSAPVNGSLSYKDSSRNNSTMVTLRSTNIKSYKFSTLSTGTNQLADVTYTANGNRSDTIEYIAYVNNTPQFTGKVVFNGSSSSAANMQVGMTCTSSQGVAFAYSDFYQANGATLLMTSYIHFVVLPSHGTLTFNGNPVTSSTNVAPTSLSNLIYRPNAGFNNETDRLSFLCYDSNNNSVGGGQVSIVVTGNGGSAATAVGQFKDVSASAWYRNDLITLMNAGIIKGRGDGKFDPTAELTYGEALKIFVLAAGYPAQPEATGKEWAINYKKLAVGYQWINDSVDLSAKISRNAMAELAAKALGVSPTDGVPSVWTDGTSNGYANALYYTNPQILKGNGDGTFKGTSTLLRQEICAIAARVLSYKSNQFSSVKPDGV